MGQDRYVPRTVDKELKARLASAPVVVLEGPKSVGKTMTARQVAESEVRLDIDAAARTAAAVDPALVLDGAAPRLIDEWQVEPQLWNHVRSEADRRGKPGQFILTGSAVPWDDETRHSGAGRISRITMRPLSMFELGRSAGTVSLRALLDGQAPRAADPGLTIEDVADLISRGGWPAIRDLDIEAALVAVRDYLNEIRRTDISRVDKVERDPERVRRLLASLGRNVATSAAITKLAHDTGGAEGPLDRDTVADYLNALARLFIVEDQPAWGPHLRSRVQVRVSPKRHFVDPSLAVAALGASPKKLLRDLNFMGFLFESLVIRDLRVYGQELDARVLHYRDNKDLEIDAIVHTTDERWAAFEIKLGGEKLIDEGAASLLRFSQRVDTAKVGVPACLGVIVARGYGFVRRDGVAVIPVGSLRP